MSICKFTKTLMYLGGVLLQCMANCPEKQADDDRRLPVSIRSALQSIKEPLDHTFMTKFFAKFFKFPADVDESELYRQANETFKVFDVDANMTLDNNEFSHLLDWLNRAGYPRSAFIVVDVQNDFINGSLAVPNATEIIDPINRLTKQRNFFDLVVFTKDWHPANHISFFENRNQRKLSSKTKRTDQLKHFDEVFFSIANVTVNQILWPTHCVQGEPGAELHSQLITETCPPAEIVLKGQHTERDSYSAFMENDRRTKTRLDDLLRLHNVTHVFVCGLAYDVCVASTANDAVELGYATAVIDECSKGISDNAVQRTKTELNAKGVQIIDAVSQVSDYAMGILRPWQWAYQLARIFRRNNPGSV